MCLQPKDSSCIGWIDPGLFPPGGLIAAAMYFAVMPPTERHSELVADLAAERRCLGKAQMVSIGGPTTTDQTRLLGNRFNVITVANASRRRQR
jgi:hypothetical protein